MPEEPQERTYKHQVSADFVLEAITTLTWSEEQTKKFNKKGIYRGAIDKLLKVVPQINKYLFKYQHEYTLLFDTKITNNEDLKIENIKQSIPSVISLKSQLSTVTIDNCQLDNTNFYFFNSNLAFLWISESKIGFFEIRNSFCGDLWIYDNSSTKHFWIENSSTGYFKINENSSTGFFLIRRNSNIGFFEIYNSNIGYLKLNENSSTGYFNITNSNTGDFGIGKNCSTGDFDIINSKTGDLRIYGKSKTGDFWMENSESTLWSIEGVQAAFYFSKTTIGQCQLNTCDIAKLTIKNECAMELYISGGTVNLIDFEQLSLGKSTILSFSKIALYACNMIEFSALSNLYFRGVIIAQQPYTFIDIKQYLGDKPDNEHLKTLYQTKNEQLENQKEDYERELKEWQERLEINEPTFRIVQSSLGKTEFTKCDFGGFRFEYNNSKLTEIFGSGGTLPKKINIHIYKELVPRFIKEQKKAYFNQLKKIFENQGDIVRSVSYRVKAAEIEFDILNAKKRKLLNPEWWVYFLNKWSNNFGLSWLRALAFVILSSIIFFTFYLLAGEAMSLNPNNSEWSWNLTGQLFTFINPTHRLSFMADAKLPIELGFWTNLWDFVGRIVIGYGIYQFISAFRKHGKRA